jgi:nucleoside-diphosphate-sugar epimerase
MRIVVTGATGNVGTSVVEALAADPAVSQIVGIARRATTWRPPKTRWVHADVERDDLTSTFEGADAVIHLAWLIQPSRDPHELERVNVHGSRKVFETAARAGARALIHASSIGVYSPGPKDDPVDESWPRDGVESSFYSRHKAAAERLLDAVEGAHPELRVVRLRPGLIFKREAGPEIRRLFAGPLLPGRLADPRLIPVLPLPRRLVVQCVHTDDVAQAYRLAATQDVRGAFNIAAAPVLDHATLGRALGARVVEVPERALRIAADLSWRAHLQPSPAGWVDMGLSVPVMDTRRAREELGWTAARSATEALHDLLAGLRDPVGGPTPPLDLHAGGPGRIGEVITGVGRKLTPQR